jgi:NB-ARC domain
MSRKSQAWTGSGLVGLVALVGLMVGFDTNLVTDLISDDPEYRIWAAEHRPLIFAASGVLLAIAVLLSILGGRVSGSHRRSLSVRKSPGATVIDSIRGGSGPMTVVVGGDSTSAARVPAVIQSKPVKSLHTRPPEPLVGREADLAALDVWYRSSSQQEIFLVDGEAGVGKSGLLLHWADRTYKQRALNVLTYDFQGFAPPGTSKNADDAVAEWLLALRPKSRIPDDVRVCRARLRQALGEDPAMLVLDNVKDPEDVRSVLQAAPEQCRVIVASRHMLDGIGSLHPVKPWTVRPLDSRAAAMLFDSVAGGRIADSQEAGRQLVSFCGGLPLVLRILGASIRQQADVTSTDLVRELRRKSSLLSVVGRSSDSRADVRAVLSWSVDALPSDDARRAFKLLGVHPSKGGDTNPHAMAAILGTDPGRAKNLLDVLMAYHLVVRTRDSLTFGNLEDSLLDEARDRRAELSYRYSRHDLLQEFAAEFARKKDFAAERRSAWERAARLYYSYVNHAFDRRNRDNPMVDAEECARWRAADPLGVAIIDAAGTPPTWFERERKNIVSLVVDGGGLIPTPPFAARLACSAF